MSAQNPDAPRASVGHYAVLGIFLVFSGLLGHMLALFLTPQSEFARLFGFGIYPAGILAAGFVWQQLWSVPFVARMAKKGDFTHDAEHVSPQIREQRRRAIVMAPVCVLAGILGGAVVGYQAGGMLLWVAVVAYALVGLAIGGLAFMLAEFDMLPELKHEDPDADDQLRSKSGP